MSEIIFRGTRHEYKFVKGQGHVTISEPFEMRCTREKEHVAVSPDGLHCWVRFRNGSWRFAFWDLVGYQIDEIEEDGVVTYTAPKPIIENAS